MCTLNYYIIYSSTPLSPPLTVVVEKKQLSLKLGPSGGGAGHQLSCGIAFLDGLERAAGVAPRVILHHLALRARRQVRAYLVVYRGSTDTIFPTFIKRVVNLLLY